MVKRQTIIPQYGTVMKKGGHESSKITMDIYAKVKYNRPDELVSSMSEAFANWEAVQEE